MGTDTSTEFALRSLAIDMLSICSDAGLRSARISVILKDEKDPEDYDWWKLDYETQDGTAMSVSAGYGGADGE